MTTDNPPKPNYILIAALTVCAIAAMAALTPSAPAAKETPPTIVRLVAPQPETPEQADQRGPTRAKLRKMVSDFLKTESHHDDIYFAKLKIDRYEKQIDRITYSIQELEAKLVDTNLSPETRAKWEELLEFRRKNLIEAKEQLALAEQELQNAPAGTKELDDHIEDKSPEGGEGYSLRGAMNFHD